MKSSRFSLWSLFWLALLVAVLSWGMNPVLGQGKSGEKKTAPKISKKVLPLKVKINPDDLRPTPSQGVKTVPEGSLGLPTQPPPPKRRFPDPVIQLEPGSQGPSKSGEEAQLDSPGIDALSEPIVNVAGIPSNVNPPDTVGDIGRNHYIQMTNAPSSGGQTVYQIFDKSGNDLSGGPVRFGGLWPSGDCRSDKGDPIVVYDHLADRWLLSQFYEATTVGMCIAISQTPDPTDNLWYLYQFETPDFPDYPKFGVWPDGYYMSSYEGALLGLYVFERTSMLFGQASYYAQFVLDSYGQPGVRNTRTLPTDLDGPPPPYGTPNYFVRTIDDQQWAGEDCLRDPGDSCPDVIEICSFGANWITPLFTLACGWWDYTDGLAPFDIMTCDRSSSGNPDVDFRDCIPQPGTTATVDALSNRPMMQLKYRIVDGTPVMVFNQTIDVSGSINARYGFEPDFEVAGVRWYELRDSGSGWEIAQQGTYAPQVNGVSAEDQLLHRWMGSAAIDKDGNIALGFNIVNDDDDNPVFPGISYAGRRFDDLPGFMGQGEKVIFVGTGSEGGDGAFGQRWGDYSAMSVDPVDDCTFWFTSHAAVNPKPTRIASFRFDTCGTDLAISKSDMPDPVVAGTSLFYTITVQNYGPSDAENVVVTDTLPTDVTYLSDSAGCSYAAPVLTCELGDLAAGAGTSFVIQVEVNSDATGPLTNVATVTSDSGETYEPNNTATQSTFVETLANLRVTKECKPDEPLAAGDTGICTVTVTNLGPSLAQNVHLDDVHVSEGQFSFGDIESSEGSCLASDGTVSCDFVDLDAGDEVVVTIEVTADEPQDINNIATVSSDTDDPDPSNNQASDGVSVFGVSDLSVIKRDAPDPVVAGTELIYSVELRNLGPSRAVNVVLKDLMPAGISVTSVPANCQAGEPGNASKPTVCGIDSLDVGPVVVIQFHVMVDPRTTGILQNDVEVSSDYFDPDNNNNFASESTTVNAEADLIVSKTDFPDPVIAGTNLTYDVTVRNEGPSTAIDTSMSDTLPAWVTFLGYTVSNGTGTCTVLPGDPPNVLSCDLNDLDPGQFVRIVFEVFVDPSTPDGTILENTAAVGSRTFDPDLANNGTTPIATTVNAEADLSVTKDATIRTDTPAPQVTYTILVTNNGPSDALNVVLVDALPLDPKKIVFLFADLDGDATPCGYDEGTHDVTCDLGTMAPGTSRTAHIIVDIRGSVGSINNTATVTTTTTDPNAQNNTVTKTVRIKGGPGKKGKN